MKLRLTAFVLFMTLAVFASAAVAAEETRSLRFEKELSFKLDEATELKAQVGGVKVSKVAFTTTDKASIMDKLSKRDSELSTTLRASFDVENPGEDDWEITFSLEALDKKGKPIDRWSQKKSFGTEAKTFDVDHRIQKALLPLIDSVKIKLLAAR